MGRLAKPKPTGYEKFVGHEVEIVTEGYDWDALNRTCKFTVEDVTTSPNVMVVRHLNGIRDHVRYDKIVSIRKVEE